MTDSCANIQWLSYDGVLREKLEYKRTAT